MSAPTVPSSVVETRDSATDEATTPDGHRAPWPVSYGSYVRGCRCEGCAEQQRAYYEENKARATALVVEAEAECDEIAVERAVAAARAGERADLTYRADRIVAAYRLYVSGAVRSRLLLLGLSNDMATALYEGWAAST